MGGKKPPTSWVSLSCLEVIWSTTWEPVAPVSRMKGIFRSWIWGIFFGGMKGSAVETVETVEMAIICIHTYVYIYYISYYIFIYIYISHTILNESKWLLLFEFLLLISFVHWLLYVFTCQKASWNINAGFWRSEEVANFLASSFSCFLLEVLGSHKQCRHFSFGDQSNLFDTCQGAPIYEHVICSMLQGCHRWLKKSQWEWALTIFPTWN